MRFSERFLGGHIMIGPREPDGETPRAGHGTFAQRVGLCVLLLATALFLETVAALLGTARGNGSPASRDVPLLDRCFY